MASTLYLPPHLAALDLGESLDLSPEDLRAARPAWLDSRYPAADRALRYGRGRGGLAYDAIAERTPAAFPAAPTIALQTRATVRRERERDAAHRRNATVDGLIDQIETLRHRSLDLPLTPASSYRFVCGDEHLTLFVGRDDGREDAWTFSLAHPPRLLIRDTVESPAATLATQHCWIDFPGVFWLPLSVVIERGAFPRFQDTRGRLSRATQSGCVYLFLSHRWLATSEPDPERVQARFFAWQLLASLGEAIEIAGDRGLHEPRRASTILKRPVGRFGTELAESLVVNLLQPNLDDQRLASATLEIAAFAGQLENRGSAVAEQDQGLQRLRDRLQSMPIVRSLLERVFVWYDYACLPQAPREEADELLFRDGLAHLNHVQVMGATAILLDEVDDYLGRAWCVLEAVTAESVASLAGGTEVFQLAASRRSTNRSGKAEHYNAALLRDCRHLMWRALLDTEVFACQTVERCMERLGLAVTDPADLRFVYEALRRMQVPDAPTDDLEVVTGVFPLPFADDAASVYWRTRTGRRVAETPEPASTETLDWTQALRLQDLREAIGERRSVGVPPLSSLLDSQEALLEPGALQGVHLAVVGSCEGEATLLARWVRERHAELEQTLGLQAVSISWLATDIAPVGCLLYGALQSWTSLSHRWVIIATESRLRDCEVTGHLIEMMRALGRPYGELAIDRSEGNLRWYKGREMPGPPDGLANYPIVDGLLRTHRGGLYRAALLNYLLPASGRRTS